MHKCSYNEMGRQIKAFENLPKDAIIVDFGSQDVNGSYRALIEGRWKYVGIDLELGQNVDFVMASEYNTGLADGYADGLICGQVLEHCRDPFKLTQEMARIVKQGAFLLVTAPVVWPEHKFPFDCWRFLPDGMIVLFDRAGVQAWHSFMIPSEMGIDCWFIGQKK